MVGIYIPPVRKEHRFQRGVVQPRYRVLIILFLVLFSCVVATVDYFLYEHSCISLYDDFPADFTSRQLKKGPGGGDVLELRPQCGDPPLRLYKLHEFCAAYAPELQNATWADESVTHISAAPGDNDAGLPSYPFFPRPVCFRNSQLFYDGTDLGRRRGGGGTSIQVVPEWRKLTDRSLSQLQRDTSLEKVVVVPAIGVVPLGEFMVGQLYHIMNDLVAPLMTLMTRGGNTTVPQLFTELAKSPTQIFTMPHKDLMWPRARKEYAVPQTKHFMGAFSYPTAPSRYFFDGAPILHENTLYCTCQGMLVGNTGVEEPQQRRYAALRLAADLILRYMNETPYESAEETGVAEDVDGVPVPVLRRFSHMPHIARRFWTTEVDVVQRRGVAGSRTATVPVYRPRLLLITRKRRRVHNSEELAAMAERLGFNVQVVDMETMSLEEQFHVARHADVVMGMHGMGLTHVLWMDGRQRSNCRTLIELMPFGCPQKLIHFYSTFSKAVNIHYEYVEAVDMYLDDVNEGGSPSELEKEEVLKRAKRRLKACNFHWYHPRFYAQVALYNVSDVEQQLVAARERLRMCGIS